MTSHWWHSEIKNKNPNYTIHIWMNSLIPQNSHNTVWLMYCVLYLSC